LSRKLPPTKLGSVRAVSAACARLRKAGKKVVFTNGCFDILHVGHVRTLRQARSLGDALVVGMNTDASVRRLKGASRPLVAQSERAEVLSALGAVDHVVFFGGDTPLALIRAIRPDFLVKGGDWKKTSIVGWDFVESYGGRVRSLRFVAGRSTTRLAEKIRKI